MIKTCQVCHKSFESYDNNKHHAHGKCGKYKRPCNAKTCSPKCSRALNLQNRIKPKVVALEKLMKTLNKRGMITQQDENPEGDEDGR